MTQREIASGFIYPQSVNLFNSTSRYGKNIHKSFKILKGVDIELTFFIKNENGKSISLFNSEATCIITKSIGNFIYLTKKLIIEDELNGVIKLILSSSDTISMEQGFYNLFVTIKTANNINPVFLDTTFASNYPIEVLDNFINSIPTIFTTDTYYINSEKLYTKQFPSSAQYTSSFGLSTFAIKLINYTGKVWIEATLETSPKESDWFVVDLSPTTINNYVTYTNYTGIEPFVFEGKFYWVRFVFEKTQGTIDKVLYSV
jgi:hypothetical protein